MSDGEALRAHIQDILLDYALTHLTTDYVAYTYTIANEVRLYYRIPGYLILILSHSSWYQTYI